MFEYMFVYRAIVTAVYDADTITVDIDLGFHIWARGEKIRLFGINAPEVRGPERPQGLKSRDWLRERILDKEIVLKTHRAAKGKYGRWLGDIFLPGSTSNRGKRSAAVPGTAGEPASLNNQMIGLGLAEPASY